MSELSMSKQEREEFLAALHVGLLAVDRPDGPPMVAPIWYRYASDRSDRETRVDIASRYLGPEMGTGYVDGSPHADDLLVRIRPTQWRTIDFAKRDSIG